MRSVVLPKGTSLDYDDTLVNIGSKVGMPKRDYVLSSGTEGIVYLKVFDMDGDIRVYDFGSSKCIFPVASSKDYRVIWEIDLEADSPEDAAAIALQIQRDSQSLATAFDIIDQDGRIVRIDIS